MKGTLLIFIFFVCSGAAFCQVMPVDKQTGRITYTGVVKSDSVSQKELYKAAQLWVVNAYNPNNILGQFYDDDNSSILLKLFMINYWNLDGSVTGNIHYTLKIECRDGRYKYTFTDFSHVRPNDQQDMCDGGALEEQKYACTDYFFAHPFIAINKKDFWDDIKKQTNKHTLAIIADMQKAICLTLNKKEVAW